MSYYKMHNKLLCILLSSSRDTSISTINSLRLLSDFFFAICSAELNSTLGTYSVNLLTFHYYYGFVMAAFVYSK